MNNINIVQGEANGRQGSGREKSNLEPKEFQRKTFFTENCQSKIRETVLKNYSFQSDLQQLSEEPYT